MTAPTTTPLGSGAASNARSPWLVVAALVPTLVLALFILALVFGPQRWHTWMNVGSNAQLEPTGPAPWVSKDRRGELQWRIERINREIPALIAEADWLNQQLKKEQAHAQTKQERQDYVDFIQRETQYLQTRIEDLQSDRDYYVHELDAR